MNLIELFQGFIIGLSLIVAIGPQNLFVIQQGLKKKYIFTVCLICSFSDSLLIIVGIFLSTYLSSISTNFLIMFKIIGGVWLIIYGVNRIYNSIKKKDRIFEEKNNLYKNVIINTLILTYINPHVYLDTVILLGAISQNFNNKAYFASGAIFSSFLFFYFLGFFSKFIGKYIKNNKFWIWIDSIFGSLMILYGILFVSSNI